MTKTGLAQPRGPFSGCLARLPHPTCSSQAGPRPKARGKKVLGVARKKKFTKFLAEARKNFYTDIPHYIPPFLLAISLLPIFSRFRHPTISLLLPPFRHISKWATKFTTVPLVSIWVRSLTLFFSHLLGLCCAAEMFCFDDRSRSVFRCKALRVHTEDFHH